MMYNYITENNLENRQFYMYCKFEGMDFLKNYLETRMNFIGSWQTEKEEQYFAEKILQGGKTERLLYRLICDEFNVENKKVVDWLTKDFEVRKRVYTAYDDATKKPEENADYHQISNYILLGYVMSKSYDRTGNYKYLNCLLKIDDTLLSVAEQMSEEEMLAGKKLFGKEVKYVQAIMETKKVAGEGW